MMRLVGGRLCSISMPVVALVLVACSGGSDDVEPNTQPPGAGAPGAAGSSAGSGGASAGAPSSMGGALSTAGAGAGAGAPSAGSGGTAGSAGSSGGSAGSAGIGGMPVSGVPFVYVGSTNDQISIYKLDAATGTLTSVKSVAGGDTPSFFAFDAAYKYLYAVNEGNAKVAAFSIDPKTGDLTLLNRVDSGGQGPTHISLDRTGKYALVANYTGGNVRVFPIGADGKLGTPSDTKSTGMNAHMIATDPANKFAFVANLGSNNISQFAFDATTGKLTANAVPSVAASDAGAGPRHFAFHPNGKNAYVLNETNDKLATYTYNAALGQLSYVSSLSTIPGGVNAANNSCAEIFIGPSGAFLYGSNRGHDSIALFAIDGASGNVTSKGTTPSGGGVPRNFAISPDGKTLIAANESGNLTTFAIDGATGALTKLKGLDVPPKPQFVGIAMLPGGG